MAISDLYGWFPSSRPLTAPDDRRITTPENAPHALTGDMSGGLMSSSFPGALGPMSQQAFNLAGRPSMMPNAGSMLPYADYPDSGGGGGAAGAAGALGLLNQANQANNLYQKGAGVLGLGGGVSSSVGTGALGNAALADAGFGGSSAGVLSGATSAGVPALGAGAPTSAAAAGDAAAGVGGGAGAAGLSGAAAGGIGLAGVYAYSKLVSKRGDEKRNQSAFKDAFPDLIASYNPGRGTGGYQLNNGQKLTQDQYNDLAGAWYGATYAPDGDQQSWQQKWDQLRKQYGL